MGLTIFCRIFFKFKLNGRMFYRILSIPPNTIVLDMNDVMKVQGMSNNVILLEMSLMRFLIRIVGSDIA